MPDSHASEAEPHVPRRSRRSGTLRVFIGALAVLCILAGFSLWLITRSWFIIWQLTPELERKLGGEVTIASANYQGEGRVEFEHVVLRARGVSGPAGEIAHIGRARVSVALGKLIAGDLPVTDVEVDDVVLRISEDSHTGKSNFAALEPKWSDDKSGSRQPPPRVYLRHAAIEFGSHSNGAFERFGRRTLTGNLFPTASDDAVFHFNLIEVDEAGNQLGSDGLVVKGDWDFNTGLIDGRLSGFKLDDRLYRMCPQIVRLWWDRMRLEGQVDSVHVQAAPGQTFSMEFDVKDVALTLPIETDDLWARYRDGRVEPTEARPRMSVDSGKIYLGTDRVLLQQLTGRLGSSDVTEGLASVPYKLSLSIPALPPMQWDKREQWLDELLKNVPFDLQLELDEFSLERSADGQAPALDLPMPVAKVLAKFEMTNWVLSSKVRMSRAAPERDDAGRLIGAKPRTEGQVYISKASGRYQKFPYRLDDVDAYLQFDNEKVTVQYLTGKGSGGSSVWITGMIAPPENDAMVDLKISGKDMPIDDRLREALEHRNEVQAFEAAFPRDMHDSLRAAGLLPDDVAIEAAKEQRASLIERIAQLKRQPADDAASAQTLEIAELERRVEQLNRHIAAGPFQLGGVVDLDLRVERPLGPKQPTTTTGTIAIKSAGVLYDRFPYPLRVTGGTLDWQPDRIVIVPGPSGEGLPFVTAGGGRGSITGEFAIPKISGKRKLRPNLKITVDDDQANDLVYAAIPPGKKSRAAFRQSGWPGALLTKAAEFVRGLGLEGAFDYVGSITTGDDGQIDWKFNVTTSGATARPTPQLARLITPHADDHAGPVGRPWPQDFAITQLAGSVEIAHDGARWSDLTGVYGGSEVRSQAQIAFDDVSQDVITVDFARLPLDRSMLNLAPPKHAARVEELWSRYQPQGTYDATIEYRTNGDAPATTSLTLRPRQLDLLVAGNRVLAASQHGQLRLSRTGIGFEDLALELANSSGESHGTLALRGSIDIDAPSGDGLVINGEWFNGRFESPLVLELLHLFASDQQAIAYRRHQPSGDFDANFRVHGPAGDQSPAYAFSVRPRNLALRMNDTAVQLAFREGQVMFTPAQIMLDYLRGQHADGEFDIGGTIDTQGLIEADLRLAYNGRLQSPQFQAFMPAAVRQALQAIEFDDGVMSSIADAHLKLVQTPKNDQSLGWASDFAGQLETRGAAFTAGIRMKDVDGIFDLAIRRRPDAPPELNIAANVFRARALGQSISEGQATLTLTDNGEILHMPSFRAKAGSGAVYAQASVGVGERREYDATIDLVALPLAEFNAQSSAPSDSPPSAAGAARVPQGELYASLALSGMRGDSATRRGRGLARVLNGDMASVPIMLQLLQALQFTFPFRGSLDSATADLFVNGDRVVFEHILFESTMGKNAPLQLFGEGEMDFQTLELKLRFQSPRSGLVVLRDIVGELGDRLYEIEVTGPLHKPQARIVPLPPARE